MLLKRTKQTGIISPLSLLVLLLIAIGLFVTLQAIKTNQNNKSKAYTAASPVEGIVGITHTDSKKVSKIEYSLLTSSGSRVVVDQAQLPPSVKPGSRINAQGTVSAGQAIITGSANQITVSSADTLVQPALRDMYAIRTSFTQGSAPDISDFDLNNFIFTVVNNYYKEASHGRITITGSLKPTVDYIGPATCDTNPIFQRTLQNNQSVDWAHKTVIIFIKLQPTCNYSAGYAELPVILHWGEQPTMVKYIIYNTDNFSIFDYYTYGALEHEIGHSLGLAHADLQDCGSVPLAAYDCQPVVYGDYFNVMDGGIPAYMHGAQTELLGWFNSGNIQMITTSGTFKLAPIESNTADLQVIKLRRNLHDYLYVEYRQPIGLDALLPSFIPPAIFEGATIHTQLDNPYYDSMLINTNPIPLLPGRIFTDPATGTIISGVTKTTNGLTVNVALGNKLDITNPVVQFTNLTTGSENIVSGDIDITANASDDQGIAAVQFIGVNLNQTIINPPYKVHWSTAGLSTNATYYVIARAYDTAGNQSQIAALIKIVTPTPSPSPICTTAHLQNGTFSVSCRSGGWHYYDYTCTDGSFGHLEDQVLCKSETDWQALANAACGQKSQCVTPSQPPVVSPSPTPSPSPSPSVSPSPSLSPTPTATACPRDRCGY